MTKKWLINWISVLLLFCFLFQTVYAEETKKEGNTGTGASFSVLPIYPNNQVNGKNGYFELTVVPNQQQIIQIEVQNYSEKKVTINVEANRATTGDAGITSYKKSVKDKDNSLKVDFESLVRLDNQVLALEPKEKRKLDIRLKMPQEAFVGQILGGIHFSEKPDEKVKNEKKNAVYNTFSYSIAILLTEDNRKVENQLNLINVYADQRNYRNFIEATIQNSAPTMIKNMTIKTEVYEKKSNKIAYQANRSALRMAPNSSFNFGLDLQNTELIPGEYRLKMIATADDKEYNFSKEFTITRKKAEELNDQAVYLEKQEDKSLLLIGVGGLLLLIVIIGNFMKKNRIKKKRKKRKKKNSQRKR